MGAGIRVLRALTLAACAAGATACVDFVEPDLPERGAPAVFQGALRTWDDGRVSVDGVLAPGLDDAAIRRSLVRESVRALGREVEPASIAKNGSRSYFTQWTTSPDSVAGVLTLEAPIVEGVTRPPAFRWSGIGTPQPDTIPLAAGQDLLLRIRQGAEDPPQPNLRQWQVQLSGRGAFRIGADGAPPDSLLIPAQWLPEPVNGRVAVTLSYTRSVAVQQGTDYVGILVLDARVDWTVAVADTAAGGAR